MDSLENCRGVAVVDVRGDGELGLACGNWQVRLIASTYATVGFMLNFWLYWTYGIYKHKSCHMHDLQNLLRFCFLSGTSQAICACWTRTHRRGKSSWIQRCWWRRFHGCCATRNGPTFSHTHCHRSRLWQWWLRRAFLQQHWWHQPFVPAGLFWVLCKFDMWHSGLLRSMSFSHCEIRPQKLCSAGAFVIWGWIKSKAFTYIL